MIMFIFVPRPGVVPPPPALNPAIKPDPPATEQLISDGWGYATIIPTSIQADNGAGLTKGIIGLVNKGQPRKPEDWGALRAWAWGCIPRSRLRSPLTKPSILSMSASRESLATARLPW